MTKSIAKQVRIAICDHRKLALHAAMGRRIAGSNQPPAFLTTREYQYLYCTTIRKLFGWNSPIGRLANEAAVRGAESRTCVQSPYCFDDGVDITHGRMLDTAVRVLTEFGETVETSRC